MQGRASVADILANAAPSRYLRARWLPADSRSDYAGGGALARRGGAGDPNMWPPGERATDHAARRPTAEQQLAEGRWPQLGI